MEKTVLKCNHCNYKEVYEIEKEDLRNCCENCGELFEIADARNFNKTDLEEIKNAGWEK